MPALTGAGCFNLHVSTERPDPYSSASRGAGWLPNAVGPDGVRVTLRVDPAVDRLRRWRHLWAVPEPLTAPIATAFEYRTLPGLVQRHLLKDRWAVDVETDNGDRCRVKAQNRDDALDYARQIHAGIQEHGVGFLRSFAR